MPSISEDMLKFLFYSLTCAIIARSAGLFQNPKRLCQCDGISIWDENNTPAYNYKSSI